MALSLSKGQNLSLTKAAGPSGLRRVTIGLGWDARTTDGSDFDLDSSAIVVDAATETAMVFVDVYRHGEEWKLRAIGQGYANGLAAVARDFGVNV